MGKIIAVTNVKGGVGKTTTTVNLAAALAERGRRVLAVDLDPQGSLTYSFGFVPDEQKKTIQQLIDSDVEHFSEYVLSTPEGVDVVPANEDLRNFERDLESHPTRVFALKYTLKPLRERYDYILLDSPANAGPLTSAALAAADKLVIPLTADFLAFQVSKTLFRIVRETQKRINPGLQIAGIYLAMYDGRTRHARDILTGLHATYGGEVPLFSAVVHPSVKLKEAPAVGRSILRHASTSQAAQAYRVIARELEEGIPAMARECVESTLQSAEAGEAEPEGMREFAAAAAHVPMELVSTAAPTTEPAVQVPTEKSPGSKRAKRTAGSGKRAAAKAVAEQAVALPAEQSAALATAEPVSAPAEQAAAQVEPAPAAMAPIDQEPVPTAQETTLKAAAPAPESNRVVTTETAGLPAESALEQLWRSAVEILDQAQSALSAGETTRANSLYRQAMVLDPTEPRAWIGCARTSESMPERIAFAKQALKLDPNNSEAHDLLFLTSTFMRMSDKDRWAFSNSPLRPLSVGVIAILFLLSLYFLPQLLH